MSVLDRDALEASPLADLHLIASEIGLDGFRRLRKAELIAAILGEEAPPPPAPAKKAAASSTEEDASSKEDDDDEGGDDAPRRPRRRGGRNRSRSGGGSGSGSGERSSESNGDDRPAPRGGRRGSGPKAEEDSGAEGARATGVVEVLGNGSGFVRVAPPDPSDDDIYISAAQIRRCELVSGDEVAGPTRPPRRSERYPSLARVDTINGKPADQTAGEGSRFDDLPAAFPTERLSLGASDPTVKAIEWLTPFGKGSRVLVVGPSRAGKTEALRRLARALAAQEGIELSIVLSGVRPEELADWSSEGAPEPTASLTFAASPDSQTQALERAVEQAKRTVGRGGDAVVLVDTLAHIPPPAARKVLAAARNVPDGGSLTIVATAETPLGGESTVIALNPELTSTHRFPALDLLASGTLRAELLVGDAGAEAIAKARAQALD